MNRAMLAKELRYGAGRLIALPLLCIAAGTGLYLLRKSTAEVNHIGGVMANMFQAGTMITCALVGFACGLWQVLRETRAGAWAFLRHRPASASSIFLAKLWAALVIYLLITGIPIGGAILWSAQSGNLFGPWLWAMAWPPVVDLLVGTTYVLAGLLVGVREARWFGSRILPIGIAVCVSAMSWAPWVWVALLGVVGGWLILLPAAWSSIAVRGMEARQGKAARFAVALALTPAAIALPVFAGALVMSVQEFFAEPRQRTVSHYYQLIGGEMYDVDYYRQAKQFRLAVDDEGNLLDDAPWIELVAYHASAVQYAEFHKYTRHYRETRSLFDLQQIGGRLEARRWFYVHGENLVREYVKPGNEPARLVSYVGANGRAEQADAVAPFRPVRPMIYAQPLVTPIVESSRVLSINLQDGSVRSLFTAPAGERCLSAGWSHTRYNDVMETFLTVATDAAVYLVDDQQQILFRRGHEPGYVTVSISPDAKRQRFGLLYTRNMWDSPQLFIRADAAGGVLTRTELPRPEYQWSAHGWSTTKVIEALMIPPLAVHIDAVHSLLFEKVQWRHALGWVTSLMGAMACLLLLRRDAASRGWVIFWTIVGALGGPAGVLLLLWMHAFAPRVPCAGCGRRRVVRRETCEHCGVAVAAPDTAGIGVFDNAAEVSVSR